MRGEWLFAVLALALALAPAAQGATIETFNLPNNQPTCGVAIADDGTVVGGNQAATNPPVNFIYGNGQFRYPAPNVPAGLVALTGINRKNAIVGEDLATNGGFLGFRLRNSATRLVTVPGATQQAAIGINDSGSIVGWYETAGSTAEYGFIKHGNTVTTLDDGTGSTLPTAISRDGTLVVGINLSADNITSWLYQNGAYTTLAAPGAAATFARGVFGTGWVTGTVVSGSGSSALSHGFIYHSGQYKSFDIPGAQETEVAGANARGEITGCYVDSLGTHGFITKVRQ